ncbi:MAG: 4-alpha-glucanotransferase [Spirochaetales bacterium]|nr:4-alpha-glucanotransferase [Candidatus Physcosoma equi]
MKKTSGILLPISSLPSPYGIGTLGKEAYDFVDFLAASGQKLWQILPLGPTSYGDSPYQSFSSHAGNPYFIDLEGLMEEGLVERSFVESFSWGKRPDQVSYALLFQNRFLVLREAFQKGREQYQEELVEFQKDNSWLSDYALYMALKAHFGMKWWQECDDEKAKRRDPEALEKYRSLLKEDVDFYIFIQYLFFRDWKKLKAYAGEKNIRIIGDVPIYVAMDSADVWAEPELFQLDENYVPEKVSGVPPDYFNADGQLWGNPLYNWDKMKEDGYAWWKRRFQSAGKLYDIVRFDHFRGLEMYYAVPYGETTARNGEWVDGPKRSFVDEMNRAFPDIEFMAEDLGYLTQGVIDLLAASTWPGMRILQFAFDTRESADFKPEGYTWNTVAFTGTHDNSTMVGWLAAAAKEDVEAAMEYLQVTTPEEIPEALILKGMECASKYFIVPLQDYLGLGDEARINTPGTTGINWLWRVSPETDWKALEAKVKRLGTARA